MGGEIRTVTVAITTLDSERLADGMTHDKIAEQVEEAITQRLNDWYDFEGGKYLLACPPSIS